MKARTTLERLDEIEDRKIEILMETGKINEDYKEKMEVLNREYAKLNKEYYDLKVKLFKLRRRH